MPVVELKGINPADFKEKIKGGKFVVDFSAEWCGPCRSIKPKFEKMSEKYPEITFFKVDVDDAPEVAEENGISAMPTFMFFLNGAVLQDMTVTGASESKIAEQLEVLKGK